MALRIEVDRDVCMGSGNCVFWAPAVFELDDEGISTVKDATAETEEKILLAGQGCPTQAISIWRDDEKLV